MNVSEHVVLAPYTTFGIGGEARWFAEARTEQDVVEAARFARRARLPLFALGGGSNLLVSDSGFPGLVLRIAIAGIEEAEAGSERESGAESSNQARRHFRVAAGEDWDQLVTRTVERSCAGMECLAGIPGTVGGTPVQNVGAYGQEVAQTIERVRGYDTQSQCFIEFGKQECGFAYRSSRFNRQDRGRYILTRVDYSLEQDGAPTLSYPDLRRYFEGTGTPASLKSVCEAVREIRRGKGMVLTAGDPDCRSAGSFFKNPVVPVATYRRLEAAYAPAAVPHYAAPASAAGDEQVKLPAAWLLEKAGFPRGYVRGAAGISSRHTLALMNRGGARAADILALRDEIQAGVEEKFGVILEPEPVWLGEPEPVQLGEPETRQAAPQAGEADARGAERAPAGMVPAR